jgi:hypothetical protein
MRETCARVLAAALMTGAIAFAVGMPALFGTAEDFGRSLTAPPSSLRRTVRAPAFSAQARTPTVERHAATSRGGGRRIVLRAAGNAVLSPQGHGRPQRRPGSGKPAAPKPTPGPKPQPPTGTSPAPGVGTRELASASSPPVRATEPPATAPRPAERNVRPHPTKPNGKAKGHDRGNDNGPTQPVQTTTTSASAPAATPPSTSCEQQQATTDSDSGNGNGHANGNAAGESNGNGNGGGHGNGNGQGKGHGG